MSSKGMSLKEPHYLLMSPQEMDVMKTVCCFSDESHSQVGHGKLR